MCRNKLYVFVLFQLLKNTPVSVLITAKSKDAVSRLTSQLPDGDALKMLQENSPIFYDFAAKMTNKDIALLRPIVDVLLPIHNQLQQFKPHDTGIGDVNELDVFPCLPVKRSRGCYQMDQSKDDQKVCGESPTKKHTLSPGVFIIFCQHGESVCAYCLTLLKVNYKLSRTSYVYIMLAFFGFV